MNTNEYDDLKDAVELDITLLVQELEDVYGDDDAEA